jgi:hypothetical protein
MQHIRTPARSCKSSHFVWLCTPQNRFLIRPESDARLGSTSFIVFVFDCKIKYQSRFLYQPSVATSRTLWPSQSPSLSRKFLYHSRHWFLQLILQVSFHSYNFRHRFTDFFELGFILKVKKLKKNREFEYFVLFFCHIIFFLKLIKQLNLRICG